METVIKYTSKTTVEYKMTAAAFGSGTVEVLSTPYMIALMEGASMNCVKDQLEEGQTTVGTKVCVNHLASVGIGEEVVTEAELIEIDRRRLTFNVKVLHGDKLIGEGTHDRFIINTAKFMGK